MKNIDEMTHEELANEAISMGKARNDGDLIEAGRDLQTIVDNEEESQNQANKVIDLLRA